MTPQGFELCCTCTLPENPPHDCMACITAQPHSMKQLNFRTKTISWNDKLYNNYHINSILLQNENGPCFLISFINTLILSNELSGEWHVVSKKSDALENNPYNLVPLKELLMKPEVSLADVLETLTTLVISTFNVKHPGSDDDALITMLNRIPSLHLGLNINPNFNSGVIGFKDEIIDPGVVPLLELFQIPMVHGWLVSPDDAPLISQLGNFEKCQNYIVEKQEEARDVVEFLEQTSTQLTDFGVETMCENPDFFSNNSFAILFRNNHYSTAFKTDNAIYLLLTDEGYLSRNAVWSQLSGVSEDLLVDGDFKEAQLEHESVLTEKVQEPTPDEIFAKRLQMAEDEKMAKTLQDQSNQSHRPVKKSKKRARSKPDAKVEEKVDKKNCVIV